MKATKLQSAMNRSVSILLLATTFTIAALAQTETPPAPSAPRSVSVPAAKEKTLPNGLRVAVIERPGVPLVTAEVLIKSGASNEAADKAGVANLTASMLTKGTKTRSATQIAEEAEFLGGSIDTGAGWNSSVAMTTVMPDKLDQSLAILADVVMNPVFDQKELDLLKSQTLDGLTYNLKQPGFLANYVAAKYSFDEHPAGGTPSSIASITRDDVASYHALNYGPGNAVIIFAGDISLEKAVAAVNKAFGKWSNTSTAPRSAGSSSDSIAAEGGLVKRILVVDLPKSGQASVNYYKRIPNLGRTSAQFYPATVLNSVLGGGYSSRLNQEIRIKRGLSYGAGSTFTWRMGTANFGTRTQTKNESAAEVAELVLAELKKLSESSVPEPELVPRKSVLTGNFGRSLETTNGLAGAIADLYSFGIPTGELNSYMTRVNAVADPQIREFATKNMPGGDIIIVGDYSVFKDDLAKRFPGMKVDVIKSDALDLNSLSSRK